MSATIAIVAAANASTVAANVARIEAHKQTCLTMLQNYKPQNASIEVMQAYADCVNFLYPSETPWGVWLLAGCFAILLFIAIWLCFRDRLF